MREYHERLLELTTVHPSYLVYTHAMLGEFDEALERYRTAVSFRPLSFIDFGPLRAMSHGRLPCGLVETIERHPTFVELLAEHGITEQWRVRLIESLNGIAHITGIRVSPDP